MSFETSRDPSTRSNIVIALGDVAVAFSSIIDENSNKLHLIINGMVKVKGHTCGYPASARERDSPCCPHHTSRARET